MREKELRLALVCYGGISLAVYMHGVTKEVWRLAQASNDHARSTLASTDATSRTAYRRLLALIADRSSIKLRVLSDIIAGASAGGINGVFLSQAIATGQSLEPLTKLWLDNADVDTLLAPDARPASKFTKFWATPIAWAALRKPNNVIDTTVSVEARAEVRTKLTRFVRARWFEPPFDGPGFTRLLLDAFDAMAAQPAGPRLLPEGQPLDLFVTVTDFNGHLARLKLNTPREAHENEHRLTLSFRQSNAADTFAEIPELALAGRATASFPGAFPPFNVKEMDRVLADSGRFWANREAYLERALPGHDRPQEAVLIDGSVLANAPFAPAVDALRDRPAKREVDRRFVYIDPKPGVRSVRLTRSGNAELPGFVSTIFGAISDIPREQPIRDSLEAIEGRSGRIRRMQHIIDAVQPNVESAIERLFGRTFFLDSPTVGRMNAWRTKAQTGAATAAGYAYASYGHVKLAGIVEDIVHLVQRQDPTLRDEAFEAFRREVWDEVRRRGADNIWLGNGKGASEAAITFFRDHDLGFRIRRIRFVIRRLTRLITVGQAEDSAVALLRTALFDLLSSYLDREGIGFYRPFDRSSASALIDDIAAQRSLSALDRSNDTRLADAFAAYPKAERRAVLFAYLGFPYYDISTLPLLQGEGLDEFDPIKVDRISPDDAIAIRSGGVAATLKGVEFNSFGAFFSRAYRENDYLWGRLHGADRLFDIICSSIPGFSPTEDAELRRLKRELLLAILTEEEATLTHIPNLFATLRREIDAGPLGC